MTSCEKRSAAEAGLEESQPSKSAKQDEEVSTEDLEEAMFCVQKAAAEARTKLLEVAKELFQSRNGRQPKTEELDEIFNTLRNSMMDEETAKSSDEGEDACDDEEEFQSLQNDVESAFEHVRDLGREAAKELKAHLKKLWTKENNGGEPTQEQMEAVLYHLKHLVVGAFPVEDEDEEEASKDDDYEPTDLEKEAADEDEETPAEKEECAFDFENQCEVPEEQFEKMCAKFFAEKGRAPTQEEADSMLESFKTKFTEATYDEHDDADYEKEEEPASEDEEDLEEDKSMQKEEEPEDMECEDEDEEVADPEEQSAAFQYMRELEEGPAEEDEEETPEKEEPTKAEQAEESTEQTEVCA